MTAPPASLASVNSNYCYLYEVLGQIVPPGRRLLRFSPCSVPCASSPCCENLARIAAQARFEELDEDVDEDEVPTFKAAKRGIDVQQHSTR